MHARYIDHMGTDLSVVNAARVSFDKKSDWVESHLTDPHHGGKVPPYKVLSEKDQDLIKYLADNGHHSPFNHTFITMHMKAPIFVARQLQKHEYMPWNEVSRRYVDTKPELYWPEVWRGRAENKKQGSEGEVTLSQDDLAQVIYSAEQAYFAYDDLLDENVAPEQARMVLPQNTYTEWYWSGTLHAWAKMYNLRKGPDVQKETQELVAMAAGHLKNLFPVSWKELTK